MYAASKAAVSAFTETLQNQFVADGLELRASVFYPSGGMLRAGMWESEKLRPAELARERPADRSRHHPSTRARAKEGGYELPWQDLNELARVVLRGVEDRRFVILIGAESIGESIRAAASFLGQGECPPHRSGGILG